MYFSNVLDAVYLTDNVTDLKIECNDFSLSFSQLSNYRNLQLPSSVGLKVICFLLPPLEFWHVSSIIARDWP